MQVKSLVLLALASVALAQQGVQVDEDTYLNSLVSEHGLSQFQAAVFMNALEYNHVFNSGMDSLKDLGIAPTGADYKPTFLDILDNYLPSIPNDEQRTAVHDVLHTIIYGTPNRRRADQSFDCTKKAAVGSVEEAFCGLVANQVPSAAASVLAPHLTEGDRIVNDLSIIATKTKGGAENINQILTVNPAKASSDIAAEISDLPSSDRQAFTSVLFEFIKAANEDKPTGSATAKSTARSTARPSGAAKATGSQSTRKSLRPTGTGTNGKNSAGSAGETLPVKTTITAPFPTTPISVPPTDALAADHTASSTAGVAGAAGASGRPAANSQDVNGANEGAGAGAGAGVGGQGAARTISSTVTQGVARATNAPVAPSSSVGAAAASSQRVVPGAASRSTISVAGVLLAGIAGLAVLL